MTLSRYSSGGGVAKEQDLLDGWLGDHVKRKLDLQSLPLVLFAPELRVQFRHAKR
jgi:hypothetical protein